MWVIRFNASTSWEVDEPSPYAFTLVGGMSDPYYGFQGGIIAFYSVNQVVLYQSGCFRVERGSRFCHSIDNVSCLKFLVLLIFSPSSKSTSAVSNATAEASKILCASPPLKLAQVRVQRSWLISQRSPIWYARSKTSDKWIFKSLRRWRNLDLCMLRFVISFRKSCGEPGRREGLWGT